MNYIKVDCCVKRPSKTTRKLRDSAWAWIPVTWNWHWEWQDMCDLWPRPNFWGLTSDSTWAHTCMSSLTAYCLFGSKWSYIILPLYQLGVSRWTSIDVHLMFGNLIMFLESLGSQCSLGMDYNPRVERIHSPLTCHGKTCFFLSKMFKIHPAKMCTRVWLSWEKSSI